MKYRCLRDCYVDDRFWREGETYELPDDMVKSEKNFQPLEEALPVKSGPSEPKTEEVGDYLCPKCKVTHRAGSKIHKRHLKYIQ